MEKILSELKQAREEAEQRFDNLVEGLGKSISSLHQSLAAVQEKTDSLSDKTRKELGDLYDNILESYQHMLTSNDALIQGLRESKSLFNARAAELARQLTVLPLDRMDLVLDKFERRLEAQEVALQKLSEKKKSDT